MGEKRRERREEAYRKDTDRVDGQLVKIGVRHDCESKVVWDEDGTSWRGM